MRWEDSSSDALTKKTPFVIEIEYWNLRPGARLQLALHLYTAQDIIAFTTGNGRDVAGTDAYTAAGLFRCACYVPADLLNTGRHRFVILEREMRNLEMVLRVLKGRNEGA